MTIRREPPRPYGRGGAASGPSGLIVVIGDAEESRRGYEVTSPTRLLRAWRLLTAVNEELHADGADEEGARRAAKIFNAVRDEAVHSISAPLAEEVRVLLPPLDEDAGLAAARVTCSSALGWLDGLMASMLTQLAGQGDRLAHDNLLPPGDRPPGRTSQSRPAPGR
ncbi:hypothetical protein [Actinomadura monticuli]|uniref:Bacterial proteasome activator n=1 Tax=Actinomadura monticuli TaxID=3097367 RepID=A0ABV4QJY0_9ACTN